ncbi:MAG TPA: fused MFS/spermidine synthase [Candidatus Angelobacter sp.]|nr:fused MFS/spermidine synthase [Candidatus Angelobacter sp.]
MPRRAFLHTAAIFLSSSLLFLVEPMAGKRLLPLLGGSSAVWITCLVFFQSALLLGYLCAHFIATRLPRWPQLLAYGALLVLSVVQVAANLDPHPHASTTRPVFSVLWLLTTLIGLPFLTLSATNPLLQSWYAHGPSSEGQDSAKPPYHLFALSNFGSLLALLVYPLLVEPNFSLRTQTLAWSIAFLVFVIVCSVIMAGRRNVPVVGEREQGEAALVAAAPDAAQTSVATFPSVIPDSAPSAASRALWLLAAAGGSLLLSAVTNHLSQNIAAIPLLWILPLTIYLLTFVLAFNGGRVYSRWLMVRLLAVALGGVAYLIAERTRDVPIIISVPLFCLTLFIGAFFCHGELYLRRPAAAYLTQYYLLIAAGGALGSMFVGVLAPLIFNGSYEMAWGLVYTAALAAMLMWRQHWGWRIFWPVAAAGLVSVVVLQHRADTEDAIAQVRSFYGTLRVTDEAADDGGRYRTLIHGTIQHGTQFMATEELRRLPTTYYSRNSGVGLALDNCCKGRARRVADIGLGTGTLAAYGEPGDVFRFYEIDPRVEVIAKNVFTYLRESKAQIEITHGDARLSMEAEPSENYDVIAVDAFSGDAIPVHLLTAEALKLYQRHLAPGGIIAFHISNSYLKLAPVVQEQADHAGLHAVMVSTADDDDTGAYSSDWVLVTANEKFLELPEIAKAGEKIEPKPGLGLWTDDYSSLLPILNLRRPKKDADESDK